jgi:hypothetical protein
MGASTNFILPLSDFFARLETQPAAVNIAAYAARNSIRREVMGKWLSLADTPIPGLPIRIQNHL